MRVGRRRDLYRPNLHPAVRHLQLDEGVGERHALREHAEPDSLGLPPAFPVRGHGTAGTSARITGRGKQPTELRLQAHATDPRTRTTVGSGVDQHGLEHMVVMAKGANVTRPRPVALAGFPVLSVSGTASLPTGDGITPGPREKDDLIAASATSN